MTTKQLQRLLEKRIQQLRLERGLKQVEMCQFGFEYKYYQRIEYGEKNLSLKTLKRLSKAFKIELAEVFNFQDSGREAE